MNTKYIVEIVVEGAWHQDQSKNVMNKLNHFVKTALPPGSFLEPLASEPTERTAAWTPLPKHFSDRLNELEKKVKSIDRTLAAVITERP